MPFIENNEMLKALPVDRTDQALNVRILPWGVVCDHDLFDAHVLDSLLEERTADGVAIANQEPRGMILRKRLDDLLSRPLGCRMGCYVEVDNLTTILSL